MLRHSFGKHVVSKNINLSTIKALIGHENIQTTFIYARSDEESMIRAVYQKDNNVVYVYFLLIKHYRIHRLITVYVKRI
jgi:integrase